MQLWLNAWELTGLACCRTGIEWKPGASDAGFAEGASACRDDVRTGLVRKLSRRQLKAGVCSS